LEMFFEVLGVDNVKDAMRLRHRSRSIRPACAIRRWRTSEVGERPTRDSW
jgi:hypothetical protein